MRLPAWTTEPLFRYALRRTLDTGPDFVIGDDYLQRWFVTPWAGRYKDLERPTRWQRFVRSAPVVYLHRILTSDDDRALHDHPAASMTIVLMGSYFEHVPVDRDKPWGATRRLLRREGDVVFRWARRPHRIELPPSGDPCMTLFVFGFRLRRDNHGRRRHDWWGFHCPKGWRHWRIFTSPRDRGRVGRGCD